MADDKIEASLKAITTQVTGERRGPGGHILTGPVYVEGAEPGDALEVKIPVDIAKANARSSPWRRGQGVDPTTGLASVPMPS